MLTSTMWYTLFEYMICKCRFMLYLHLVVTMCKHISLLYRTQTLRILLLLYLFYFYFQKLHWPHKKKKVYNFMVYILTLQIINVFLNNNKQTRNVALYSIAVLKIIPWLLMLIFYSYQIVATGKKNTCRKTLFLLFRYVGVYACVCCRQ